MKDDKELKATIAHLESQIDLLEAELVHLNSLLVKFGFSRGIDGLKRTIGEILDGGLSNPHDLQ